MFTHACLIPSYFDDSELPQIELAVKPIGTAILTITALGLTICIVLLVATILALRRSAGHRLPFWFLAFGAFFYFVEHVLDIVYGILAYETFDSPAPYLSCAALVVSKDVFGGLSASSSLLTTILILWNRHTLLAMKNPEHRYRPRRLKRVLDVSLIALLVVLVLSTAGRQMFLALMSYVPFGKTREVYNMGWAVTVFHFLTIIDIIVTATVLKRRISRSITTPPGDSIVNFIVWFILPLLTMEWIYSFGVDIYVGIVGLSPHDAESASQSNGVVIAELVQHTIFTAAIIGLLTKLGIQRDGWNTLGVQAPKGPTYYPLRQPTQEWTTNLNSQQPIQERIASSRESITETEPPPYSEGALEQHDGHEEAA